MREGGTGATRLRRVVPAGLMDAGLASLATLAMGLYAVRTLHGPELGAYALFFAAFTLAAVVPAQLILIPAQNHAVREAPQHARLGLLGQTWRLGGPVAILAAVAAAAAALVVAEGPSATLWALALTTTVSACVSPLQDHVRRTLHLSGLSWTAAVVSLVQLTCVLGYLAGLGVLGVPTAWRPFGALALANMTSLLVGLAPLRHRRRAAMLPRHTVAWLMRSGRWLLGVEAATAGAMFVSSALVSRLASPDDLGVAEAARVVAQPVFVLAVGLAATLGPRLIESGAAGDEGAAKRIARPFVALVIAVGVLYGAITAVAWSGNPLADLVPSAYAIPFLVPVTVLAMTVVGTVFSRRSELVGGGRERLLPRVSVVAGALQIATAVSAAWTGAFARPLGVAVFGITLLIGFERYRRAMYRRPALA
jgi:O-antigen/teichoic acid export membrane protein